MHFAERISVALLIYSQLLCIVSVRIKFYGSCSLLFNYDHKTQRDKSLLVRW